MKKLQLLLLMLLALPIGMLAAGTSWQTATLIEKGGSAKGTLSNDHTEDWYKIQVPENGEVTITSTPHGELDLYYTELYALDSENILRSRDSKWIGKQEGAFTVKNCAKGTYYVVVRRNGGSGEYTVKYDFKATSSDYPDDNEPNNTWEQAKPLPVATNVTGHFGYVYYNDMDTEDWFKIEVPENGEVTITSTPHGELDLYYTELYALDSENILRSRDSKWIGKEQGAFTVYNCAKGTYYVVLRRNGGQGGYTVRYDFKATSSDYPDDNEPNNTWEQAKPLPVATNVTGHFGYVYYNDMDTEDWFKIEVPENGEVTITSTPHGELDLYYTELYALDSENILRSRDSKWIGKEQGAFTVYNCAKGTYYVVLRRNGGQGGYTVRYDFKATSAAYPDDIEPNNSWETAKLLKRGNTVTGHLGYFYYNDMDTEDWFKIEVPRDGTIKLNFEPHGDLNLYYTEIYALDSENILRSRDSKWSGTDPGEIVVPDVAPGIYYIVMRRNGGQGAYSLQYKFIQNDYATDSEPNNTKEKSISLSERVTVAGHLGYFYYNDRDTEDWYKIIVSAQGIVEINVKPTGELDLYYVTLYDGNDRNKASKWVGKEEGKITIENLEAGTYYINVTRNSGYGTYFLCYNATISNVEKLDPLPDEESDKPDNPTPNDNDACLIVWRSETQKDYYLLTEKPKITMSNGDFILTTTNTTVTYKFEDVMKFTLSESSATAIEDVKAVSEPSVERQSDRVIFTGCAPKSAVRIYSIGGQLVDTQWADENGRAEVSISGLTAGVYVVKADNVTIKIAKR